jgi:hypothetical protein
MPFRGGPVRSEQDPEDFDGFDEEWTLLLIDEPPARHVATLPRVRRDGA